MITPNNDDYNDRWCISGIADYEKVSIKIFNRWGDLIFDFDGTGLEYQESNNQWDGTIGGNELPMGSYVYILDLHNDKNPYNGIITIKK